MSDLTTLDHARQETPVERRTDLALALGWVALLVIARLVGIAYVHAHDTPLGVHAVPWTGRWSFDMHLSGRTAVTAMAIGGLAWVLPGGARRGSWRFVLVATGAATAGISLLLAWAGPDRTHWPAIQAAYAQHTELVHVSGPGAFLRDYVATQPDLATHLRAHPPGFVLGLWGAEGIGLTGTGFHLALMLLGAAVSAVAVLVAAKEVAGATAARAAAPFVVLAPAAVWHTNPDVVFGAVALAAVALVIVATGQAGRSSDVVASAGGIVFAVALMCSYGLVLLAIPAAVVVATRRKCRVAVLACLGAAVGLLIPWLWGFWWPEGLLETRIQYRESVARSRGYAYWLLGNPAVFASLLGPAVVVALGRLRSTGLRPLVLAGLACPLLAALSGLSSAETERIWQPFAPLVLLAGGALWLRGDRLDVAAGRRWLALQAAVVLGIQATLVSTW